jgi:hypothetical protein
MSNSGAVTLGDIADKGPVLEIECLDCERFGRYRIAKLIEQHGANFGLPHLREILAADCPRMRSVSIYERCAARITTPPLRR